MSARVRLDSFTFADGKNIFMAKYNSPFPHEQKHVIMCRCHHLTSHYCYNQNDIFVHETCALPKTPEKLFFLFKILFFSVCLKILSSHTLHQSQTFFPNQNSSDEESVKVNGMKILSNLLLVNSHKFPLSLHFLFLYHIGLAESRDSSRLFPSPT